MEKYAKKARRVTQRAKAIDDTSSSEVQHALRVLLSQKRARAVQLFSNKFHPTASAILDKGLDVLVMHGSGALTMRSVAKLADITLGSLQYHFNTFDDMVSALVTREFGKIADVIWAKFLEIEALGLSPEEALQTAGNSYMVDEDNQNRLRDTIYFHLLAFCACHENAQEQLQGFYGFYNTLIAYLVSRVNSEISEEACLERATLITSALEGCGLYTILLAGGQKAERAVHRNMGKMAVNCARMQ